MARTNPSSGVQIIEETIAGKSWHIVWDGSRLLSKHRSRAAAATWVRLYAAVMEDCNAES